MVRYLFAYFIIYFDRCYLTLISGFLIVAACVMTFEARDSATKVVPTATITQKDQVIFYKWNKNQ